MAGEEQGRKPPPDHAGETSLRVRAAMEGDAGSLEWVVSRFSPLLLLHARSLLGTRLRRVSDPEDLVSDVWAVALPRLRGLPARSSRYTPVLMRFLATTLRFVFSNLAQKHLKRLARQSPVPETSAGGEGAIPDPATSSAMTKAIRGETRGLILRALEKLGPEATKIVLLKGFEQLSNGEVAERLGLLPNTVGVKYGRSLDRLRRLLPGSVFDEFPD